VAMVVFLHDGFVIRDLIVSGRLARGSSTQGRGGGGGRAIHGQE